MAFLKDIFSRYNHILINSLSLTLLLLGFVISCKDSKKSNTGASEYDKLMNKADIVLEEKNSLEAEPQTENKAPKGTTRDNLDMDVQFISGIPMYNLSTGYNVEEHERFLAATKLCWSFDYKETFGETRKGNYKNGGERINIASCCASFIPSPFLSPFEYYYSLYHGNTDIKTYKNNVFKLKEIRENLVSENFESFKNMIAEAKTDNLESYSISTSTIQNYNFNTEQLEIRYYISNTKKVGSGNARVQAAGNRLRRSVTHFIPMSPKKAKAIYEHYGSLNEYNKNPPFQLITKTTYSMGIPAVEKRPYNFEIALKKIEFFRSSKAYPEPEDKIGEIQFIEKPSA